MTVNPFLDPAARGILYGTADRLARRTTALLTAKIAGGNAADTIAGLAASALAPLPAGVAVLDVGCGRGSTTRRLADSLAPTRVVALDAAPALLADARLECCSSSRIAHVCGDFHRLPFADHKFGLTIAAFCLYHSPTPHHVVAELARCLTAEGVLVAATKSAGSYRELDHLVAAARLDPDAERRPSLYQAFHSDNMAEIIAASLTVEQVWHEVHRFRFRDLAHFASYLSTTPKYHLPVHVSASPTVLARALAAAIDDGPVETTSTVSYAVARKR